jgi:pimeloyl-ACP methyl ester carboxylesterase
MSFGSLCGLFWQTGTRGAVMPHVQSADGTRIAYDRTGRGPALVLVVGAFCHRLTTKSLSASLAEHYTVYEYDRRGRGDSGDTASYAPEREIEDLAAIVTEAGGAAFVYGHSSGAVLALEAAASGVPVTKLAVYEPPYTSPAEPNPGFADELAALVADGRRGEAAERFIAVTGAPPEVIAQMRTAPFWPAMEAIAHTLPYDLRLVGDGFASVDRLAKITASTLALAGGTSPQWASAAAREVASAVPESSYRVLPGQDHGVTDEAIFPVLREFFQ